MIAGHRDHIRIAQASAHLLERRTCHKVVMLPPQHHHGKTPLTQDVELHGQISSSCEARREPERPRIPDQVRQTFGQNDGKDTASLANGKQVGREMDTPVPQGALRHGAHGGTAVRPCRTTHGVDEHQRADMVRVVMGQLDGNSTSERVTQSNYRRPHYHRVEECCHPVAVGRQFDRCGFETGCPTKTGQGRGIDVQACPHEAGKRPLVCLVVETPAVQEKRRWTGSRLAVERRTTIDDGFLPIHPIHAPHEWSYRPSSILPTHTSTMGPAACPP